VVVPPPAPISPVVINNNIPPAPPPVMAPIPNPPEAQSYAAPRRHHAGPPKNIPACKLDPHYACPAAHDLTLAPSVGVAARGRPRDRALGHRDRGCGQHRPHPRRGDLGAVQLIPHAVPKHPPPARGRPRRPRPAEAPTRCWPGVPQLPPGN
jgi:hypothetical protein